MNWLVYFGATVGNIGVLVYQLYFGHPITDPWMNAFISQLIIPPLLGWLFRGMK